MCPDAAQTLVDSNIVFTISWGDCGDGLAYSDPNVLPGSGKPVTAVSVILDKGNISPEREGTEGIAYAMANEMSHCINFANGKNFLPTQYEEAIAMVFQHNLGNLIGYEPSHNWWENIWFLNTKMQTGYNLVERIAHGLGINPDYNLYTIATLFMGGRLDRILGHSGYCSIPSSLNDQDYYNAMQQLSTQLLNYLQAYWEWMMGENLQ
jgi:hypothetical protein